MISIRGHDGLPKSSHAFRYLVRYEFDKANYCVKAENDFFLQDVSIETLNARIRS